MSVAATTAPNPGWYPDPHAPEQLRWWNGSGWTENTQQLPRAAAPAAPGEPAFVATTAADPEPRFVTSAAPSTDFVMPRFERAESGFVRDAMSFVLELPEEDLGPAGPPPVRFSFRSRAADDLVDDTDSVLMYVSPLAATKSPLREAPPLVEDEPIVIEDDDELIEVVDAELVDDDEPQPEPEPATATPKADAPRWKPPTVNGIDFSTLGRPGRKTAIVAVAAASAALLTNVLGGGDDHTAGAAKARPGITAATKDCLKLWNTTDSASASAQRVTLGQFAGSLARVGHVAPLSGTLMQPNSCGLTVYDPGTDTNAVFVAGVKDQIGYLDVTAYPRAAKQYRWPKTTAQANVTIQPDGTLVAKG